jgi:arabinofuranan 3-O-arabinosyltransferase
MTPTSTALADLALTRRIEATFGGAAPMIRYFGMLAAALMAIAFFANLAKMMIEMSAPGFDGQAVAIDFTAFWAAAKLGVAGDAASAFNVDILRDAQRLPSNNEIGDTFWLYPPAWHIAIMPLGLLPFPAAYIVYSAITFAVFAIVVRPLAAPLPGGVALVLAAPAVLIVMNLGNNSLLWAAGLVAALAAMNRGQFVLAGLLISLLTLKPQLGLLIPFALAFGGHWRTIVWACIGTVAIVALSTIAMGVDYWGHYLDTLNFMSRLIQTGLVRFELMMSWYAFIRFLGAGHELAFPAQLVITGLLAAAVSWVWSRRGAGADIKAATLFIAIPLATPYAYHYEMTLTLIAAMFLARDGFGGGRRARLWLLVLWLGSVPGLALEGLLSSVIYAPPMLTATLGLCMWRAARPDISAETQCLA